MWVKLSVTFQQQKPTKILLTLTGFPVDRFITCSVRLLSPVCRWVQENCAPSQYALSTTPYYKLLVTQTPISHPIFQDNLGKPAPERLYQSAFFYLILSYLITTPAPRHSMFLQAGCSSRHPTNSAKAKPAPIITKAYVLGELTKSGVSMVKEAKRRNNYSYTLNL